jgi:hypothetical protein
MMLSLNIEFNGSAINLLVSRDEATIGPSLATDYEQIWFRPGETLPERARHTIQDRTIMVTIAWNSLGFPLIVALPKERVFNAEYYRDNILATLTQFQPEDDGRKLVVHADNARAHTAQNVELLRRKWTAARSPSTLLT